MAEHKGDTKPYQYALVLRDAETNVTINVPPETFVNTIRTVGSLFGFDFLRIPLIIYARKDESELWQAVYGADELNGVFFPIPLPTTLEDEEYYDIGRRALDAYLIRSKHLKKFTKTDGHSATGVERRNLLIGDLERKLGLVENVIDDVEMAELFELRFKKRYKQELCAEKLHVSPRTVNRKVHEMAVHIGRILHSTLKPRELLDLTRFVPEKSVLQRNL